MRGWLQRGIRLPLYLAQLPITCLWVSCEVAQEECSEGSNSSGTGKQMSVTEKLTVDADACGSPARGACCCRPPGSVLSSPAA